MLAIRMQRTGRKGHAQFRVVVQDAHRTPSSGRVVTSLGHYDPHTKVVVLEKEKAELFLKNGARPSERVARLLLAEGIKLPKWVVLPSSQSAATRNPDKLRKNKPKAEVKDKKSETPEEPTPETDDIKAEA
ncbi:MAG: 30S ribosomal protein S16 [Candidatus Saccharimonadales bacterium]